MEPIVEDAVPDVDRADETLRLMCLYGLLSAAVTQVGLHSDCIPDEVGLHSDCIPDEV
jgi:hypothetical protein